MSILVDFIFADKSMNDTRILFWFEIVPSKLFV